MGLVEWRKDLQKASTWLFGVQTVATNTTNHQQQYWGKPGCLHDWERLYSASRVSPIAMVCLDCGEFHEYDGFADEDVEPDLSQQEIERFAKTCLQVLEEDV